MSDNKVNGAKIRASGLVRRFFEEHHIRVSDEQTDSIIDAVADDLGTSPEMDLRRFLTGMS